IFCGALLVESGVFKSGNSKDSPFNLLQKEASPELKEDVSPPVLQVAAIAPSPVKPTYTTDEPEASKVTIGSTDLESGFEFELVFNSRGASIERAVFSGFKNRDPDNPVPLELLAPTGENVYSMANREFVLFDQNLQLPLHKENWNSYREEILANGSKRARFDINIYEKDGESTEKKPFMKVTKTYTIALDSYLVSCDIEVENFSSQDQKIRFNMNGPTGIGREDTRNDMRKVVGGFYGDQGKVVSDRIGIRSGFMKKRLGLKDGTSEYEDALHRRDKNEIERAKKNLRIGRGLKNHKWQADFLWVAIVNKYFAAILVPVPEQGKDSCDWVSNKMGLYYNPDRDERGDSGDETIGIDIGIATKNLQARSKQQYNFQLYLGPKDKRIFDKNELYRGLGFVNAIDFMPCFCCPAAIIRPLAFGILSLMEWLYKFIGNYGVVIIILVFMVRIILHPLSKKGQVSMHRMGKLAPKMEEIKKKYANNKAELQKQIALLYREHGASPVTGMLPMFVQMPIWISLYSAIYASVSLRGAAFLPFWITDLSAPDALIRFKAVAIPLLGWKVSSLNLLPIMMGVAFYLQQKLMPQSAAASTNPQMQQQQKMMKIMMPLLFPLMLYNAPSGLNLYIMASTFAGVIEQYVIRKHIREKEEAESQMFVSVTAKTGGKVKKKKPKPFYKNR
ncbi:MAG: YidC/Oxa1 family insertase periplasmic-domain containing protein, partial [Planctomycetota bacterium]